MYITINLFMHFQAFVLATKHTISSKSATCYFILVQILLLLGCYCAFAIVHSFL